MSSESDVLDKDLWRKRKTVKVNGTWTVEGRLRTQYKLLKIEKPSNIPGKSYVAVLITVPPNSAHNGAAVYAQVIKGKVYSQMIHPHRSTKADGTVETVEHDSGVAVYGPGEMWYEAPGCHHVRSENASDEEAQFYANFIIDTEKLEAVDDPTTASALTVLDVDPRSPFYEGR